MGLGNGSRWFKNMYYMSYMGSHQMPLLIIENGLGATDVDDQRDYKIHDV